MSVQRVNRAIAAAIKNDPPNCASNGVINTREAKTIVKAAETRCGKPDEVDAAEGKAIGDLFDRRANIPSPGEMVTLACPETPSPALTPGAMKTFEAFFTQHDLLHGENLRSKVDAALAEGYGPALPGPPAHLNELAHVLVGDDRPVDGALKEAFVDREKGTFYLKTTIESRLVGGTVIGWYGPLSLDKSGAGGPAVKAFSTDRQVHMSANGSKVSMGVGIGAGVDLAGGKIGLEIAGQHFSVVTQPGGDAMKAFDNLRDQLWHAGYDVEQVDLRGIDTINLEWNIKGDGIPPGTHRAIEGEMTYLVPRPGAQGQADMDAGWYLVMPEPLKVANVEANHIFVSYAPSTEYSSGTKLTWHGRLDVAARKNEAPAPEGGVRYARLSGASNLTAGEPSYDGKEFRNSVGNKLMPLTWVTPQIMDIPATLFLPDPASNKVFIGSIGGYIPPTVNPFHGFRGSTTLREATNEDRAAVALSADGTPKNAQTNRPLDLVGSVDAPYPDAFAHSWYFDPSAAKLYHFTSGGFAGLRNQMTEVADISRDWYHFHE